MEVTGWAEIRDGLSLNDGQKKVFDAIVEGDNVCVTGGAGVGKRTW